MQKPGKTLVIGCESFLGKRFYQAYQAIYPDTIGTHYRFERASRNIDLNHPNLSPLKLEKGEYSYALIAASNANPSLCEKKKQVSFKGNVGGTLQLLRLLMELEIQPILFSSPYVFNGEDGNYRENSKTDPINEYGKQKEFLEKCVRQICGNEYLMIRCGKVFDLAKTAGTLIDQICTPLVRNQSVQAAHDLVFSPIWIEDVVRAVMALQKKKCRGLYNLCGKEVWTRLELARRIGEVLKVSPHLIEPISLDELKNPFKIPKKTDMCCEKLHNAVHFEESPLSFLIQFLNKIYLGDGRDLCSKKLED